MKKLWIITELFPPDETSTSYILGEIANAASTVYDVHVICGPEIYDIHRPLDHAHAFKLNTSIKVVRANKLGTDKNTIWGKLRSFWGMSKQLYQLVKSNVKCGDKVLLVTNPAPLVLLMSKLKKNLDFEFNILVHDIFPENTIPAQIYMPKLAYNFLKNRFNRAYSMADKLIVLGRDMEEVLRNKVGNSVKIEIVENWADVENIHPLPFPKGIIKLEYAGNIGRVQGLERLVDELPSGVELHFYGTGAQEDKLKKKGIPNVYFHGPYHRSQQENILGASHIAIVTLADGMYGLGVPSKAYNIMASGRPIIYFGPEKSEIELLIKEHGIGYIGWPDKWDLDEFKSMGIKSRELAEVYYNKRVILKKFLKVIE